MATTNQKKCYSRLINLEVGIPKDDIEAYTNSVKLELLADIIDNIDLDPHEYLIEKYLNLKKEIQVNDKPKENRDTE